MDRESSRLGEMEREREGVKKGERERERENKYACMSGINNIYI